MEPNIIWKPTSNMGNLEGYMSNKTMGRRMGDVDLNTVHRELANHEVRIEVLEVLVTEQTRVMTKIDKKIAWLGGIISCLIFLMTPMGISLWQKLVG